ncbi:hypothetical protein MMC10_002118 [Thelotrema lepadinum]|nr:hypothetical protein [Thelotrema lepadinum]
MPHQLSIPPCIKDPRHPYHFPPLEQPLRIQIDAPATDISTARGPGACKNNLPSCLRAGTALAGEVPGDLVVRDEYLAWMAEARPERKINYYGVTFDHLVPTDDLDPEVLQINIIEMENDDGVYALEGLPFEVDVEEFRGKKVLAVPRCCQKRKGTQDRRRINVGVKERDRETRERIDDTRKGENSVIWESLTK